MAITQRTPTSGTAAASANFTVTLPTGTNQLDYLLVTVAIAVSTGTITAPTGWRILTSGGAGTLHRYQVFGAPYTSSLTLTFTNIAGVAAWIVNAYSGVSRIYSSYPALPGVGVNNSTNNTTMTTGTLPTQNIYGCYDTLHYSWNSNATISTVAAGSTISATQANGTTISVATGFNNINPVPDNTTVTNFSQTLSAACNRKSGVHILLYPSAGVIKHAGHPFYF